MFQLDNSGGNRSKKYWLDFWCWDHWLSFFGGAIVLRFPLFFPFHTIWLLILQYYYYAYLSLGSIKLRCPMSNVFGKKWPTHVFFHTSLEYFLLWWFRVDFPLAFFLWVSSSNHRLNFSMRGCELVSNFKLNSTWIVR